MVRPYSWRIISTAACTRPRVDVPIPIWLAEIATGEFVSDARTSQSSMSWRRFSASLNWVKAHDLDNGWALPKLPHAEVVEPAFDVSAIERVRLGLDDVANVA